jgi:hypothetical protein
MTSNEHQIANIVKIVSHLIQQDDIHSRGNIIGDKTIYAKEGLFVGDYNPNYDFFIKGKGCITGDVFIKGNLFYENKVGELSSKNYIDVFVKKNETSGFRIRDDISVKGLIWDFKEEEFVFADENFFENLNPRQPNYLSNIRFKNANFINGYCKNLIIENSIIGLGKNIKLDSDIFLSGNLKIKGNIYSMMDTLNIESHITTKSIKVEESIFVENSIEVNTLRAFILDCGDIKARNIQLEGNIRIKGNCDIDEYFISNSGAEFKTSLEVKGSIYIGKNLIFTGEESGIAFSSLCNIENASVSYINGKKILNEGDILVTQGIQEISNKSLGSNLDAKFFKICNLDSPSNENDAVNKKYVDQYIIGSHILEPTRLATIENINCLFSVNQYQMMSKEMGRLTIDGVDAEIGDRILIKNQQIKSENGIYVVVAVGNRNQQWILQIAEDWEDIIKNRPKLTPMVMVRYGTENGKKLFGMNIVYSTIWEIMGCEEFLKKGWSIYEKLFAKIIK